MSEPWKPPATATPPAGSPALPPVGSPASPPRVLLWQKVYCFAMAAVYLLCAALGLAFVVFRDRLADENATANENLFAGVALLVIALPLAAAYAAGPFLPRRPWAWVYHVVLICLSLTSCACLPFAIPLLIFWIEPRLQAWFGRGRAISTAPPPPALPGAPA